MLVVPNCDEADCCRILEKIEHEQRLKRKVLPQMDVAMGFGIRTSTEQPVDAVIQAADEAMYRDKTARKAARKAARNGDQGRV